MSVTASYLVLISDDDRLGQPNGAHTMKLIVAAGLTLMSLNAMAQDVDQTVAQKNGWASYNEALAPIIARTNTTCAYDKITYREFDPLKDRTQSACQAAVSALDAVCTTDAGKSAVRKLRAVSCEFSSDGTGVVNADGVLRVRIDPVRSGITGQKPGSYSWASALRELL
jgi:hypothetical protein